MSVWVQPADIQAVIQTTPFSDGPTPPATKPTLAQVGAACNEVESELNATFQGLGIPLPIDVTSLDTLAFLKRAATCGVCERVFLTMGNYLEKAREYRDRYDSMVAIVRRNPKTLSPVASITGVSAPTSTIPEVESTERAFQRDAVQW